MSGKKGGTAKPLKQPKKDKAELDDDDLAFKKKQQEDAAKLKALKGNLKDGKPMGQGLKKSGKK